MKKTKEEIIVEIKAELEDIENYMDSIDVCAEDIQYLLEELKEE